MWTIIRSLLDDGTTVMLTTQYLDEADQLAHRISVVDHGRVIAEGTPAELKATTGQQRLEIRLTAPHPAAVGALRDLTASDPTVSDDGRTLTCAVVDEPGLASAVVTALGAVGATVDEVAVHRPSLDDVFFSLTGHGATDDPSDPHEEAA
jgi:ABC-2 type transport system ATP-binding protein